MKNFKKSIKVIFLLFFGYTYIFCQTLSKFTDSVEIMKLDQTLHSRSQLGGVCVDRLGYIYVANFHDALWKISPNGVVKLLSDGMYGSSGNCVDSRGDLYQANFYANTIVRIDRFGNVENYITSGISGPVGMVFDPENNLYVCNFHSNNILKIDTAKQISVFAESELFNGPNGIVVDNSGMLYVVNFNNSDVVRINASGESDVFSSTDGVDGNAHISYFNDKFYVTKIKTNQVFVINSDGHCRLFAGGGTSGICGGPANEASFSAPNGIAVDAISGEIYINNLKGQWTSRRPSTIEISRIKLRTLSQILATHLDANDQEGATNAFWEYHKDTFHMREELGPQLSALGWQFMAKRNVAASILLFDLLCQAYPDRWRPFYNLGEVYKIIGQTEKARANYVIARDLKPDNPLVLARLANL
ncbi:MAG: hypothetical protein HKN76_07995 [Saprospiraceae bacterium]|nr:hypothetical protein [Saprospiraceae bacterium]